MEQAQGTLSQCCENFLYSVKAAGLPAASAGLVAASCARPAAVLADDHEDGASAEWIRPPDAGRAPVAAEWYQGLPPLDPGCAAHLRASWLGS